MRSPAFLVIVLFALVLASSLQACSWSSPPELPQLLRGQPARSDCPARSDNQYFFEKGTLHDKHDFVETWATQYLRAADEPSISCGAGLSETYRVTWLHSFRRPLIVRVTTSHQSATLVATEFNRPESFLKSIKVVRRVETALTSADWLRIKSALDAADFWSMPVTMGLRGNDGDEWLVEGRRDGGYHAVNRWGATGAYREAAATILRASGVRSSDERW